MAILLLAQIALADAPSCDVKAHDCQVLLQKAQKVIDDQKKLIGDQNTEIQKRIELDVARDSYEAQLEKDNSAWYKNPFVLVPLGILTGMFIQHELQK